MDLRPTKTNKAVTSINMKFEIQKKCSHTHVQTVTQTLSPKNIIQHRSFAMKPKGFRSNAKFINIGITLQQNLFIGIKTVYINIENSLL